MKKNKTIFTFLLVFISTYSIATQGVYEINSACLDVGCFAGDNPATKTVEITKDSGTFRLTSDLLDTELGQSAIHVTTVSSNSRITIDLNGYEIKFGAIASSDTTGIDIDGVNSIVTIKNGTIAAFYDGIKAEAGATVVVENMVFRIMRDDAISAGKGIIRNNVFDANRYGIFAVGATAMEEGDRLYIDSNLFISDDALQDPVFSMANTNYCKDNVIGYSASYSHFESCTLSGVNLCGSSPCANTVVVETIENKE